MFASVKSTDVDIVRFENKTDGHECKIQTESGAIRIISSVSRAEQYCMWITASKYDMGPGDNPACKEKETTIIFTPVELEMIVQEAVGRKLIDLSRIPKVEEALALLEEAIAKFKSNSAAPLPQGNASEALA